MATIACCKFGEMPASGTYRACCWASCVSTSAGTPRTSARSPGAYVLRTYTHAARSATTRRTAHHIARRSHGCRLRLPRGAGWTQTRLGAGRGATDRIDIPRKDTRLLLDRLDRFASPGID